MSSHSLVERLAALEAALPSDVARVKAATTTDALRAEEVRLLGQRSEWKAISAAVGGAEPNERPALGRGVSTLKREYERAIAERRVEVEGLEAESRRQRERVDLTLPGRPRSEGLVHIVNAVIEELEDLFTGMGYRVAEGPEVETDWYDFEALNLPKIHPARSMQDTIYVESAAAAADEVLLRTHTSAVQIRTMLAEKPPLYIVCLGRTVRRDTADATHVPVFHQIEGLAVDPDITFGDLAGTLEYVARALFGPERELRLRPSYFPYTEPSAEIDVSCFVCGGSGGSGGDCRTCGGSGWIELGGSGMVHPKVFENVGYDPEEVQGFAFGWGIERIAMLRHGIPDLRLFLDNDLRFLEQFRTV